MPTEQELRTNPLQQFPIQDNQSVWFDEDNGTFCLAETDSGDCGDGFPTFSELCEAVQ